MLRRLTARWNHVAIIIEETKDLTTLTLDELAGSLKSHEERMRELGNFSRSNEKLLNSIEEEAHFGNGRGKLILLK